MILLAGLIEALIQGLLGLLLAYLAKSLPTFANYMIAYCRGALYYTKSGISLDFMLVQLK